MCDNLYLHVLGYEQKAHEGLIDRRGQRLNYELADRTQLSKYNMYIYACM